MIVGIRIKAAVAQVLPRGKRRLLLWATVVGFLALSDSVRGQDASPPSSASLEAQATQQKKKSILSPRERRRLSLKHCQRYEGKVLSYYEETFRVRGCQRHVLDHEKLSKLLKKGVKVEKVDGSVIMSLPLATPAAYRVPALSCAKLNGRYITSNYEEVYFVEKCRKRLFPDGVTYNQHLRDRGIAESSLQLYGSEVLDQIKDGKPFASVAPSGESEEAGDAGVANLGKNQKCKDLEGRYVRYFIYLYKVRRCQKRPVDDQKFSQIMADIDRNPEAGKLVKEEIRKVITISDKIWISLPLGPPHVPVASEFYHSPPTP